MSSHVDFLIHSDVNTKILARHQTLSPDLVITHRSTDGSLLGLAIASDFGIRAIIDVVAVALEVNSDRDRQDIAGSLISRLINILKEREIRRILVVGKAADIQSDLVLESAGFTLQKGERFLALDLNSQAFIGQCQVPSDILKRNPWRDSEPCRNPALISIIHDCISCVQGVQLAEWETEERLKKFTKKHGLILGHELDDLVSIGFFAHSGLHGFISHVARLYPQTSENRHQKMSQDLRGLGCSLVELGVAYLHHMGIIKIRLGTDNVDSTNFWLRRGWSIESERLWQLDITF
jgi:hypothetical protein